MARREHNVETEVEDGSVSGITAELNGAISDQRFMYAVRSVTGDMWQVTGD